MKRWQFVKKSLIIDNERLFCYDEVGEIAGIDTTQKVGRAPVSAYGNFPIYESGVR